MAVKFDCMVEQYNKAVLYNFETICILKLNYKMGVQRTVLTRKVLTRKVQNLKIWHSEHSPRTMCLC